MTSGSCWVWTAYRDRDGYGIIRYKGKNRRAHKLAYELLVGPIPEGLECDHLCRNPSCLNPAHIELVTHRENVLRGNGFMAKRARQTHCKRGHEFTPENTRYINTGRGRIGRRCLACRRKED